eukprot:TRINITY_DN460_c0_g1_i3.p1 TRINITY_DN460_c0_g1~~TRINITY_DN460_c0_g1_i3.p1  ORF type:complete len:359 (+),score=48.71 TRINITY_DN460_c0_g1_i3:98-1174(+)
MRSAGSLRMLSRNSSVLHIKPRYPSFQNSRFSSFIPLSQVLKAKPSSISPQETPRVNPTSAFASFKSPVASPQIVKLPTRLEWEAQTLLKRNPEVSYEKFTSDESFLYKALWYVYTYGICILRGVPVNHTEIEKVGKRICYLRPTIYGLTWDVKSVENPKNIAYTPNKLDWHQDLCYYEAPPGIQMLHCLEFSEDTVGGRTLFVDGLSVLKRLNKQDPNLFKTLCDVEICFHYENDNQTMIFQRPIIKPSIDGASWDLHWSPAWEDTLTSLDHANQAETFYKAYRRFYEISESEELHFKLRMKPGDMVIFDNRRVMHAREKYTVMKGTRHLKGAYINMDEFLSVFRSLHLSFSQSSPV